MFRPGMGLDYTDPTTNEHFTDASAVTPAWVLGRLTNFYRFYLGREPDAQINVWAQKVQNGEITLDQARVGIATSPEANALLASGRVPSFTPVASTPTTTATPPATTGNFFHDTLFTLPGLNIPVTGTMAIIGAVILYFVMEGGGGSKRGGGLFG